MNEESASNTQVRVNVYAIGRCCPGGDFQKNLTWEELYQYLHLFWNLQHPTALRHITPAQAEVKRHLEEHHIQLPDPFLSVCDSHRCLLPPSSVFKSHTPEEIPFIENENVDDVVTPAPVRPLERTDPQTQLVESPESSKFLVLAAPGTGKTETVLRRLRFLSDHVFQGDLGPVLCVSFSRVAAAELQQRLMQQSHDEREQSIFQAPRISTLDSFAGKVLAAAGMDLSTGSYDANIRLLARLLEGEFGEYNKSTAAAFVKQQIRVVVVDEVQDVVGVRARLVRAILSLLQNVSCGAAILGDLRQSIYGWTLRDVPQCERDMDAFWLLRELDELYGEMQRLHFIEQYRFSPLCRQLMRDLQVAMDDPTGEYYPGEKPDRNRLCEVFEEVLRLEHPIELAGKLTQDVKTAILARRNVEVKQVEVACADLLRQHGRTVKVISATSRSRYPGWLARVFGSPDSASHFSAETFIRAYQNLVRNDVPEAKACLEWLSSAFGINPQSFSRANIVTAIKSDSGVPTDLREQPSSGEIWISTIHQAKGRQFDVVVVVDPIKLLRNEGQDATAENCRLAYVAATRAKRKLFRCSGREWLPRIFEWKLEHLDLQASSEVGESDWCALQDELWACHLRLGPMRLFSPDASRFVLEVEGSICQHAWAVTLSSDFKRNFIDFARKSLRVDQPLVEDFTVRLTGLFSVHISSPSHRIMLIPELSGLVCRRQ